MTRLFRLAFALLVFASLCAAGFFVWANRYGELPPETTRRSFPAAQVEKGAQLALLGNCASCHTKPGGAPYAGGLAMKTPFGVIYSTNVTPDAETGIGRWSQAAFLRAMHEGIDRQGRHLYPAFPYDHFTRVSEEDVNALYAFLMSQPAVKASAPENALPFPFNQRVLIAGWNLLFFERGAYRADPAQSEEWNRGAYAVQGLGHCGSCHTPRNILGGLRMELALAGGEAKGWHAPGLGAHAKSSAPWSEDALLNYLIDGWDAAHGVAAGPMTAVVNNLAKAPEDIVKAMAVYLASLAPPASKAQIDKALASAREREYVAGSTIGPDRGEEIFARSCANCHRKGGSSVPLALSSNVTGPDPANAIQVILHGVQPPDGAPEKSMPRFGSALNDGAIADLAAFMRARFSNAPPWTDLPEHVKRARLQ